MTVGCKVKSILEINIVTYNRKEALQKSFEQIFKDSSPIRNFDITILNNNSTDGTTELIESYRKRFSNIKHIKHNRNIGGNANIARAFEIAQKKYVWVLCDDDVFDFSHWNEVEEALLSDKYHAVVVSNYVNPFENLGQLVSQMTFVPAAIYKTEVLTATLMLNMGYNISNMFPHLAIVFDLINENRQIKVMDKWIVKMFPGCGEGSYVRGTGKGIHLFISQMFWQIGFLNSLHMLKDLDKRREIVKYLYTNEAKTAFLRLDIIKQINKVSYKSSKKNLLDLYYSYSFFNKDIAIKLDLLEDFLSSNKIVSYLLFFIIKLSRSYKIFYFYKTDKGYNIKIFNKIKSCIWSNRWFRFF
jgi:glycosyltransferase involved in cell wall biosynthesis